jgi:oligopeptide transport system permease protein
MAENKGSIVTAADFVYVNESEKNKDIIVRPSISYWSNVLRKMIINKISVLCLVYTVVIVGFAIFAPMLSPYHYDSISLKEGNLFPCSTHWFGTDAVGRDLWTRIWVGARVSLLIGLFGSILPEIVGILIGGIAGYFGGWIDMAIMRIIDVGLCIPSLVYITMLMLFFGGGPVTIILALSLTGWMGSARNVRGRILQFKNREFVLASRTLGGSSMRLIFKDILPNIMGQLVVGITSGIPQAIFMEAYLSFIGMGVQSPMTSWGQLSQTGVNLFRIYPYQLYIPSVIISLTILIFYIFGNCLRDALDPKLGY